MVCYLKIKTGVNSAPTYRGLKMKNPLLNIHNIAKANMTERNGINIPSSYDDIKREYHALRNTIALFDYSHYSKIVIQGSEAFEFLDTIVCGGLADVRDEGAIYTLILDNAGEIVTDCYVLNNDNSFIILAENIDDRSLQDLLGQHIHSYEAKIESLLESHAFIVCDGPYSWELMTSCFGMDVIGIPYMGFMFIDTICIFRGGKSGEFCYKLLVPFKKVEAVWETLTQNGEKFDLVKAGIGSQRISRLENPFWNPFTMAKYSKNPIELQLQWTIHFDKENYQGIKGIQEFKKSGPANKMVGIKAMSADTSFKANEKIFYKHNEIGKLIDSGHSPAINRYIALGYLKVDYAYAGIADYEIENNDGQRVPVSTCSTPFFLNKSFLINPNEHSYIDPKKFKNILHQIESTQQKSAV